MEISINDIRKAGTICKSGSLTDEELQLSIMGTKLTLAFLEGLGDNWMLARTPLLTLLYELEGFEIARIRKD